MQLAAQGKEGGDNELDTSAELIYALNHPLRRAILRHVLKQPEGADSLVTPNDVSLALDCYLSPVAYHFRVLRQTQILELVKRGRVRGGVKHFYRPCEVLRSHPWVRRVLRETKANDLLQIGKMARRSAKNAR